MLPLAQGPVPEQPELQEHPLAPLQPELQEHPLAPLQLNPPEACSGHWHLWILRAVLGRRLHLLARSQPLASLGRGRRLRRV